MRLEVGKKIVDLVQKRHGNQVKGIDFSIEDKIFLCTPSRIKCLFQEETLDIVKKRLSNDLALFDILENFFEKNANQRFTSMDIEAVFEHLSHLDNYNISELVEENKTLVDTIINTIKRRKIVQGFKMKDVLYNISMYFFNSDKNQFSGGEIVEILREKNK